MRYLRFVTPLLLLSALLGLLAGCGGGGGSSARSATRKVTIQLDVPAAGRKTGRVTIKTIQSALVEVYDGPQRIGVVKLTVPLNGNPQTPVTATLDLPLKGLLFYANGFEATTAPDYVTNPANGQLEKGTSGALVPLAGVDASGNSSDARPTAHATALVDVTSLPASQPTVHFTWNNAIASFVPITPLNIPNAPLDKTLIGINSGAVDLSATIQAKTSDGYNVMVSSASLSAQIDPNDTSGALRATVSPANPPLLTPLATGTVRVTISDSDVNNATNHPNNPEFAQLPLSVTVTYTIIPVTGVTSTLNVSAGPNLIGSIPYYARSVTFTLTQNSLPLVGGQIQDNPNVNGDVATVLALVKPAYTANTVTSVALTDLANNGVTTIPITYTQTGHPLTLTVKAWANADGTGAVLAQNTIANITASTTTATDTALTSTVAQTPNGSFTLTPPNPTITLVNAANASPPANLNTVRLQPAVVLGTGNTPGSAIDPRTLNVTVTGPNTANAAASVQLDAGTGLYVIVVTVTAKGTATVTVADKLNPSLTGSTTITAVYGTGGAGLNIN